MKILWVSNSPIGPASKILGEEYRGSSGGWLKTEYDAIEKQNNEFCFLCTSPQVKKGTVVHKADSSGEVYCVNTPRISYGFTPSQKKVEELQKVIDKISPDIIQIWGTETWLSNAVSKCSPAVPKVIFIQGLLGVHKRYLGGYFGTDKADKKYKKISSPILKLKSIFRSVSFKRQAEIEKETISNCGNVIVDSDFARAYCRSVSQNVNCYQHTLLPDKVFSPNSWSIENCNKYTIFTIYGSSAEKGTQNLLKAIRLVKKTYPDVKAIIPGPYSLDGNGKLLSGSGDAFQNTLYQMISELELFDNVVFTGRLSASEMAEQMQRSHIFVNSSCMEVHALSLREALVSGLPCISSLCGSVAEYVKHNENGLIYRYEEYETLAYLIEKIFEDSNFACKLSKNAPNALKDMQKNDLSLCEIYLNCISK